MIYNNPICSLIAKFKKKLTSFLQMATQSQVS